LSRPAALALPIALLGCVPAERHAGEREAPARVASKRPTRAKVETASALDGQAAVVVGPTALPVLTEPFKDDFERPAIGDEYYATGSGFRIEGGRLCARGARNHPLWLRHRLPTNARIQVEAEASSADGDIKLEAWGDGRSAATSVSYTNATSYLAIFGGWKNRYHVLSRLDEHAADRRERRREPGSDDPRQQPVLAGHRYRLRLERTDGRTVRFWADDVEISSLADARPLEGAGHEHFAFNDWEAPVCFDQLLVEPLPS